MKLPDFQNFEPFNKLRELMGANKLGEFQLPVQPKPILSQEEKTLLLEDGLEISLNEISVLEDGTLAYKDCRILLHIRDVSDSNRRQISLPKFHISDCSTLQDMRRHDRFGRYVVATREDGYFNINLPDKSKSRTKKLDVCQNCLDKLRFDSFSLRLPRPERREVVENFSIQKFFDRYPKSLFPQRPVHSDATAPRNEYTEDFQEISREIKIGRNWACEKCGLSFAKNNHQAFLHAHHKNGLRHDNCPDNISILCLGCHAEQFRHSHIRSLPVYNDFIREFGEPWRIALTRH